MPLANADAQLPVLSFRVCCGVDEVKLHGFSTLSDRVPSFSFTERWVAE